VILADKYKLYGSKRQGERVDRVLLKGTSTNPEEYLEVGGEAVELDEEQVAELRARGVNIRKANGSDDDADNGDDTASDESGDNPDDKQ